MFLLARLEVASDESILTARTGFLAAVLAESVAKDALAGLVQSAC